MAFFQIKCQRTHKSHNCSAGNAEERSMLLTFCLSLFWKAFFFVAEKCVKRSQNCNRRQSSSHGAFHRRSAKSSQEISRRQRKSGVSFADTQIFWSGILHDQPVRLLNCEQSSTSNYRRTVRTSSDQLVRASCNQSQRPWM